MVFFKFIPSGYASPEPQNKRSKLREEDKEKVFLKSLTGPLTPYTEAPHLSKRSVIMAGKER
jgi:hypothetical protein